MRKIKMVLYSLGILFIIFNLSIASGKLQALDANPVPTIWEKFYHGPLDEKFNSVEQTSDGGYILVGQTNSFGASGFDGWILKTDENGNVLWNFTYGGPLDETFKSVYETSDHGFLIAGTTDSYGKGDSDFWIVKVDSNGTAQFNKTIGTSGNDNLAQMIRTSDGNFAITGRYHNASKSYTADVWLIKVNETGDAVWNHTYGGERYDVPYTVTELSTGGYAIATWTGNTPTDPDQGDVMVIKVNENGIQEWNSTYGIVGGTDIPARIVETSDGGVLFTAFSRYANALQEQIAVVKLNATGSIIWNKDFGGSDHDWGNPLLKVNGGYFVLGHTFSYGPGNGDNILIKIDEDGNQIFNQTNGLPQDDDFFWDIKSTSDSNYICAGMSASTYGNKDGWLVKIGNATTTTTTTTTTSSSSTNESSSEQSSPGFELIPLVAVVVILTVKRKRK